MGLLTPKNSKDGKKNGGKQKGAGTGQGSQFIKQSSKPSGFNKKPVKTGGARGS